MTGIEAIRWYESIVKKQELSRDEIEKWNEAFNVMCGAVSMEYHRGMFIEIEKTISGIPAEKQNEFINFCKFAAIMFYGREKSNI